MTIRLGYRPTNLDSRQFLEKLTTAKNPNAFHHMILGHIDRLSSNGRIFSSVSPQNTGLYEEKKNEIMHDLVMNKNMKVENELHQKEQNYDEYDLPYDQMDELDDFYDMDDPMAHQSHLADLLLKYK